MFKRQEVDCMVSMIICSLPFPALPVCALQGEEMDESFASSHDLLSGAITAALAQTHDKNASKNMESRQSKQSVILGNLMSELMILNERYFMITSVDRSGLKDQQYSEKMTMIRRDVYYTFCKYFRDYMSCYPGSSDLRIGPLDVIDVKSNLYTQTVGHLKSMGIELEEGMPYEELLDFYLCELCA
jgi:hypothetical protein